MRRLPIYFVLDVSESMVGENLKKLDDGINSIIRTLRQDPYALETVHVGVIAFAGKARTIVPLIEVASFYPPKLPIGSGTSLGRALFHLMAELDKSVDKTTLEHKGDWKPIIYLITDGKPTDSVSSAVAKWKSDYANRATLIAIALGRFADTGVLKQLTEHALILENTTDEDFKLFYSWITDSVKSQSKSVSDIPSDDANLAKLDETILSLVKDTMDFRKVDPDYVILTGRCQRTRLPYLMKYERNTQQVKHQDFSMVATNYTISGCYPLGEEYFEWSDTGNGQLKVNTSELLGTPGCPHCGNISAFAICACGGIMCLNGLGTAVCPWCEKEVTFSIGSGDDEGFDVNRAQG
ncbi:TerY-C metal binding domain-containing protein [Nitrosomonas communis]|uniref:TerY-C metal binding domain-containing protein n=1 Tax=Nitrosomonas communis TaxID=44574 RepID=UPI0026F09987|nr:TerY-C metal binding domain-containing protein [Nitrosomonas communis]MCO6427626.1 VWA domain-containing protein [Nitrosomonas communis]